MPSVTAQKNALRKKILEARKNFDESRYFENNEIICQKLLKLINSLIIDKPNCCIGIYYPLQGEPNLLKLLFLIDQHFALPVVLDESIEFVKYFPGQGLEQTNFKGLYQPIKKTSVIPDIIIIPALSFDTSGYRLGFGKGHHDKYFAAIKSVKTPTSIGVCFHDFLTDRLPFDEDDHKLTYIVTEKITVSL